MNHQKFVSGTLHSLWMDYFEGVLAFAGTVFEQSIVPFCDERGWAFSAVGNWCNIGPPGERPWEPDDHKDDEEWQKIAAILTTTVKGLDGYLGSLMPDYQPEANDE